MSFDSSLPPLQGHPNNSYPSHYIEIACIRTPPLIITFHVIFMLEKGYRGLNGEDNKVPYNKKKLFILKMVDRNMCIYFGFSSNPCGWRSWGVKFICLYILWSAHYWCLGKELYYILETVEAAPIGMEIAFINYITFFLKLNRNTQTNKNKFKNTQTIGLEHYPSTCGLHVFHTKDVPVNRGITTWIERARNSSLFLKSPLLYNSLPPELRGKQ